LAEARAESGRFGPTALDGLFDSFGLPRPGKVSNVLLRLERAGQVARLRDQKAAWRLTPAGRERSTTIASDLDLAALVAEAATERPGTFAHTLHPLIPPAFAPPELLEPLRAFLAAHPFDRNVFGMTRFPDEQDAAEPDPIADAIETARSVCAAHGLDFHLASDRMIVDDLWANVAAHMWACRYGIGFFEDRRARGINYNLTIEVGGMLVIGRRLALLKDRSIERLPTDLVGKIYKTLDLDDQEATAETIHVWLRDDLQLEACSQCPRRRSPSHAGTLPARSVPIERTE
jgi:hypothetical protein